MNVSFAAREEHAVGPGRDGQRSKIWIMVSQAMSQACFSYNVWYSTGGFNFSVQVGFGAIAPAHPTRISAASECIGSRYMMYTDTLQPTESMVRRSTDPPLIPTRPARAVPSVERMEHGERLVRSRTRAHEPPRAPVPSALRGLPLCRHRRCWRKK